MSELKIQNHRFNDRHVMLVQQSGAIELQAVTEMISVLGYRVKPIEESGDALSCVCREPCDVAIIELNLRPINGYQLARRIRRHSPGIRILLMTACCQAEVVDYMDDRVVDGWLFKPFGIEALNDMLENVQESKQEAELVEKWRVEFRRPENTDHYTAADYKEAERKFVKYRLNGQPGA